MARRIFTVLTAVTLALSSVTPVSAAEADDPDVVDLGDDVRIDRGDPAEVSEPGESLGSLATDPLGLVVGVDTIRDHSLGFDELDVWSCGAGGSATQFAQELENSVGRWFTHYSRGWYQPRFEAKGDAGTSPGACENNSRGQAGSAAEGAIHLTVGLGGFASPGAVCGFDPCPGSHSYRDGNRRVGFIGEGRLFATGVHEIGHMLSWPHSFTGPGSEYDNPLDVMSGNYARSGNTYGSYHEPFATAVINMYAAGWIPDEEVYVHSGGGVALDLATQNNEGWKMAVIGAGSTFYTLAARVPSTYDPIPQLWSGVEVYEVTKCTQSERSCVSADEFMPGFRRVKPSPGFVFDPSDFDAYEQPLPHVIRPGETRTVGGVQVQVGQQSGQSFRVRIGSNPVDLTNPVTVSFLDTSGDTFVSDIEWLADEGITRGCNPPLNSLFCPDEFVTRGQMAAFLHRALPDLATGAATDFTDDNGHTFEADIEWLAATGVTRGCNPPSNDRFCPDEPVTRGQMAAFLHRALPDLAAGPATDFIDDDGHTFEADIEWLAATGVTRGCNPPANDRFCPNDSVTRGQMGGFLNRALGG